MAFSNSGHGLIRSEQSSVGDYTFNNPFDPSGSTTIPSDVWQQAIDNAASYDYKSNEEKKQQIANSKSIAQQFLDNYGNPFDPEYVQPEHQSFLHKLAGGGNSASDQISGTLAPETVDYLNADLAKHYGMSASTAYQEALSNTSYQRAVADMQAAGLNPAVLFGNGRASGASGVAYIDSMRSGSGSGSGSGSSQSDSKLFGSDTYGLVSGIAGLVGLAVGKGNPSYYWMFQSGAQSLMNSLNAISRWSDD